MAEQVADLTRARDAIRRESWAEAYELLEATDQSALTPADHEGLADAAWWLSRMDESLAARQRSYAGNAAAGDDRRAAFLALRLFVEYVFQAEYAVAGGWLMRAERHLQDQPECVEHGYLAASRAAMALAQGQPAEAEALTEQAINVGHRFAHREVLTMATCLRGRALITLGKTREGVALLDEAMTAVIAGELSAHMTGVIYCDVLATCLHLGDIGRAAEWSDAARAWCESIPPEAPYPGLCRLHRVEVASLRGAWNEAEAEARRAAAELSFNPYAAGQALYAAGELRRLQGDLAGAGKAFASAHELGFSPQPGLAFVRLAQGKTGQALTALRLALEAEAPAGLHRARLLAAQVQAAIAASDLDLARAASEQLNALAEQIPTTVLAATAQMARGMVELAEADTSAALKSLRGACQMWRELKLPYEDACTRMLIGLATRRAGDEEGARRDLDAVRIAFERLGALVDARRARDLLRADSLPGGLTEREAQVLALVAAGKTNRAIAAALVISEHTVARHLQNIFAKLGVSSRAAATAFAAEHEII